MNLERVTVSNAPFLRVRQNGGPSAALAARTRSTGLDDDTDRDDSDIVETHLTGGGLNGRESTHLPTVSLASAGCPLGFESGLSNPHSEQLETASLSTSVWHRTADEVQRSSVRDRQLGWIREDPRFILDV